jgi:DNA polymerase III alpha subunit
MRLDKFSNPIFDEQDIFQALYQGHTDILSKVTVDVTPEIEQLATLSHTHLRTPLELPEDFTVEQFDKYIQADWFMPEEYKLYDIVDWLYCECKTIEQKNRVTEELTAFAERDMILLLKWLKYFVDTMNKNNIVWGVGRGSSVASYVLYLIGVHSIDSMKYNLDWREFLR